MYAVLFFHLPYTTLLPGFGLLFFSALSLKISRPISRAMHVCKCLTGTWLARPSPANPAPFPLQPSRVLPRLQFVLRSPELVPRYRNCEAISDGNVFPGWRYRIIKCHVRQAVGSKLVQTIAVILLRPRYGLPRGL